MIIVGIDTGIGTCGWSRFDTSVRRFIALGAFETTKQPHKDKTDDHDDRTELVADILGDVMLQCDVVIAERRSFASAASIGPISLCFGAIVGLARGMRPRPRLYTVAPKVWQRAIVPSSGKRVDYDEVEATVTSYLRRDGDSARALDALPRDLRNHALDACAIALMGAYRLEQCRPLGGRAVVKRNSNEVSHG